MKPDIKWLSPLIIVTELERAIGFYTDKLGFQVDFRYEDFYTAVIKDGMSIHLKLADSDADLKKNAIGSDHPVVIFSISEIDQFYQDLVSKSVDIVQPLRRQPYGNEFYIADPDGHTLAFVG